jgi:hypothetical protein
MIVFDGVKIDFDSLKKLSTKNLTVLPAFHVT